MRRGDIVAVDLERVRGAEADKRRPAVVVSNDMANATARRIGRGVITIVPVTSSIRRVFPFQVFLRRSETGLPEDSKAQAEQVRSIVIERVHGRLGVVPEARMRDIDEALRLHLGL